MNDLKLLGKLYQTNEGDVVFIPEPKTIKRVGEPGKIVRQPTPEDVDISKEKEVDHSLGGVLKKHGKVSEKKV